MEIKFLIEHNNEFYWNGRTLKKGDGERDPKLFWTMNFTTAYMMDSEKEALFVQRKLFNYPTRIVSTIID